MSAVTYTATKGLSTTGNEKGVWLSDSTTSHTNLVAYGGFDSSTGWTLGTGWTIASGVATAATGSQSDLSRSVTVSTSTKYVCIYTISNYSAGTFTFTLSGTAGTARSADGTYAEVITSGGSLVDSYIRKSSTGVGNIDNVIVMPVESITGADLVTNGDFPTATTGWTLDAGATLSIDTARLKVTNDGTGTNPGAGYQAITTVIGVTYIVSADITGGTGSAIMRVGTTIGGFEYGNTNVIAAAAGPTTEMVTFTATTTTAYIYLRINEVTASVTAFFDNVSCYLADPDLSSNLNGLEVHGTIDKSPVANGSELQVYSGFSASNYFEQPYNADLDYGTGDFMVNGWFNVAPTAAFNVMFTRAYYPAAWSGSSIRVIMDTDGTIDFDISDDGSVTQDIITSPSSYDDSTWHHIVCVRSGSNLYMYIDSALVGTTTVSNAAGSLNNSNATLRIGYGTNDAGAFGGSLALWRTGAYAPTAAQIKDIYDDEKILFENFEKYTQIGTSYTLDISTSQLTRSLKTVRNQSRSLSGNTETIKHRDEIMWDVQTTLIEKNSLSPYRRFIDSALEGATFTWDAYGAVNSADIPVNAYIDSDSYTEERDALNRFRIGFQVREN